MRSLFPSRKNQPSRRRGRRGKQQLRTHRTRRLLRALHHEPLEDRRLLTGETGFALAFGDAAYEDNAWSVTADAPISTAFFTNSWLVGCPRLLCIRATIDRIASGAACRLRPTNVMSP